jgi:hypothetical protein
MSHAAHAEESLRRQGDRPQISQISTDFQREDKREIGETTARVRPPYLLLSPACLDPESVKIGVICGLVPLGSLWSRFVRNEAKRQ